MTYQEKSSLISIVSTLIVFIGLGMYVFQIYQEGTLQSDEILSFWGTVFIILTVVTIIFQIIAHIITSTVTAVITKSKESIVKDERDQLIDLKGTRNAHYVFITGFAISMGMLAMTISASIIFPSLFFFGFLSALIGDVSKLYFYRRGF